MIDLIVNCLSSIDSSLLVIIITALAGSYGKDYLRIMKSKKAERVSLSTVLLSTFTASLVIYGVSNILTEKFGERFLALASFVCGLVGFQLMEKLSTIDGIFGLYKQARGLPPLEQRDDDTESTKKQ